MKTPWWVYTAILSPLIATILGILLATYRADEVKDWEINALRIILYGGLAISFAGALLCKS